MGMPTLTAGDYTSVCQAYGEAPDVISLNPDVYLNNLALGVLGADTRAKVLHRGWRHQLPRDSVRQTDVRNP
jgi:hypothetical protein